MIYQNICIQAKKCGISINKLEKKSKYIDREYLQVGEKRKPNCEKYKKSSRYFGVYDR